MNNQSGPDGCTEQTSGLDLLVGPPRAHSVRMGASCARARGALHAHVYSIQIRAIAVVLERSSTQILVDSLI